MIDAEKFWARVIEVDGHLIWQGTPDVWGYGRYNNERVHRIAWELINGPIPQGCRVKIVCGIRLCVRHLEIRIVRLVGGPACVEWPGATNEEGYGQKRTDGKLVYVHREAWERANGPVPEGKCVLHRCDNPPCYNYEHLFLGTKKDNTADMIAKGRASWQQIPATYGSEHCTQLR